MYTLSFKSKTFAVTFNGIVVGGKSGGFPAQVSIRLV